MIVGAAGRRSPGRELNVGVRYERAGSQLALGKHERGNEVTQSLFDPGVLGGIDIAVDQMGELVGDSREIFG